MLAPALYFRAPYALSLGLRPIIAAQFDVLPVAYREHFKWRNPRARLYVYLAVMVNLTKAAARLRGTARGTRTWR
jgi:hypothetical protein